MEKETSSAVESTAPAIENTDSKSETTKTKTKAKAKVKSEFESLAERYAKNYPNVRVFHITTDKQVFFEKDKNLALLHQASLGGGEVVTINL